MNRSRRLGRAGLVFLCCLLAAPTCVYLLGGIRADSARAALLMGALLGVAHIAVRPIIRLLSKPLGCLTLGLIGPVIDLGLIYGCARFVPEFHIDSLFHALLMVVLVNAACLIVGGRRG